MDKNTNDKIKNELRQNEVCLFMKGTPEVPQCGFSLAVSGIMIPDAVLVSASRGSTKTLSARGLIFNLLIILIY